MSDEINSLINQAKEQARKDAVANFFLKNSKVIIRLAIILVILGVIAAVYAAVKKSRQAHYSEYFHQSLFYEQLGDYSAAKKELLKIYEAKSAPSGVKSLASLRLAAIYFGEGNKTEANKIYEEVSKCRFCDQYIKDLSGFLLVKSWLSDSEEIAKEGLLAKVEAIENSNKIFKYHVAEQRSFLEAKKGDLKKSYQILEMIEKNPEVAPVLKERAKDSMQILISKGYNPQESKSEKEGEEK